MNNQRTIPQPEHWEIWEELACASTNENGNGDESLRVDSAGNYHVIAEVQLLDGKRIPESEFDDYDGSMIEWFKSKGIPYDSPRRSKLRMVTDLSFKEAAAWCVRALLPEPFDDYLIARAL